MRRPRVSIHLSGKYYSLNVAWQIYAAQHEVSPRKGVAFIFTVHTKNVSIPLILYLLFYLIFCKIRKMLKMVASCNDAHFQYIHIKTSVKSSLYEVSIVHHWQNYRKSRGSEHLQDLVRHLVTLAAARVSQYCNGSYIYYDVPECSKCTLHLPSQQSYYQ